MSLVSHIGKLFTSTINTRLMKWSEDNSVLTDVQFGFRPGYGTRDAISTLHSIISKSLRQGKTQALNSFKKKYAPSSSLLQGKHQPFTPSPLRLNIFRLFVILSLTQLYRYTPEIFLFSTATFKYKYRAPLRRIGQEYSAKVAFSIFQSLKRIQSLPVVLN